jgi:lysophospholipase L1-like esterase
MRLLATVLAAFVFTFALPPEPIRAQSPAPTLDLVAIGDSIPFAGFCTTCEHAFVDDYARRLEAELEVDVSVTNRSRNDGAVLDQILLQVETEQTLIDQLTNAEIVIISAGINDTPVWGPEHPCGSEFTDDARGYVDQFLSYTESCLDAEVALRTEDFRDLFAAVDEIVADSATVMVVNAYNWWTGWPELEAVATAAELDQVDDATVYFLDAWNKQECELANDRGFICIDVYHTFNGSQGRLPAGDLLEKDYSHPSKKGNALIASMLIAADGLGDPVSSPVEAPATPAS